MNEGMNAFPALSTRGNRSFLKTLNKVTQNQPILGSHSSPLSLLSSEFLFSCLLSFSLLSDEELHSLVPVRCKRDTFEPPRGKTNNVVSDQVRHKPGCTVTEDS